MGLCVTAGDPGSTSEPTPRDSAVLLSDHPPEGDRVTDLGCVMKSLLHKALLVSLEFLSQNQRGGPGLGPRSQRHPQSSQ